MSQSGENQLCPLPYWNHPNVACHLLLFAIWQYDLDFPRSTQHAWSLGNNLYASRAAISSTQISVSEPTEKNLSTMTPVHQNIGSATWGASPRPKFSWPTPVRPDRPTKDIFGSILKGNNNRAQLILPLDNVASVGRISGKQRRNIMIKYEKSL